MPMEPGHARNRRAQVLALVVALAAPAPPLLGRGLPGSWLEAKSEHFHLVGNVNEKSTREILVQFEQIHSLLERVAPPPRGSSARPLTVFVARDVSTMKLFMPSLFRARGRGAIGGRFIDPPTFKFVQLEAVADEERLTIVFHEYFHHFVRRHGMQLPRWLEEGLADFWGATRFDAGKAQVGRVPMDRPQSFGSLSLMPLEQLLQVDYASRDYQDRLRARRFYAQSWALVHYLMIGEPERDGQLQSYTRHVLAGQDAVAAGRLAFGDLDQLGRELRNYVERGRYPFGSMPGVSPVGDESLRIRRLEEPEATAWIALALLHSEPLSVASPRVDDALAGAPEVAITHTATGLRDYFEERFDSAREHFARAAELPDAGAIAHYGLALARLASSRVESAWIAAERDLEAALALDADFAPTYSRLSDVRQRRGLGAAEALALLRRAAELEPENWFYKLRELQLLQLDGKGAAARERIGEIVGEALAAESPIALNNQCWYGTLLGFAGDVLPLCDKAVAGAPADAAPLDSRGVARAVTGDLDGAAADFQAALREAGESWNERQRATRTAWIAALEAGTNPLTPDELERLLDAPDDSGGWGR